MAIVVEFYGIPRARAGVQQTQVLDGRESASLREILTEVAAHYPDFGANCVNDGKLRDGFVASVDGDEFIRDEDSRIASGQSLLILSADAGG